MNYKPIGSVLLFGLLLLIGCKSETEPATPEVAEPIKEEIKLNLTKIDSTSAQLDKAIIKLEEALGNLE